MSTFMRKTGDWVRKHKEWIVVGVVFFVLILSSFLFGYVLGREGEKAPIIIEKSV